MNGYLRPWEKVCRLSLKRELQFEKFRLQCGLPLFQSLIDLSGVQIKATKQACNVDNARLDCRIRRKFPVGTQHERETSRLSNTVEQRLLSGLMGFLGKMLRRVNTF